MPAADTKTQQLLYALGHRGASTAAANGCCNTKTQDYILDAITRITNEEDARADGDTNLQNQINNKEGKTITGAGAPTTSTEAANVGQQYYDTTNEKLYYCSAIDTTTDPYTYTWEEVGGDIPTDATFWGASYDSTNNKVDGAITSTVAGPSGSNYDVISYKPENGQNGFTFTINNYAYSNQMFYTFFPLYRNGDSSWTANKSISVNQTILSLNYRRIATVADPTSAQDAATKNYVDTLVGDIETILATLTTGTGTGD